MKIQYCSDLHLEFRENKHFILKNPLIPTGEILILAGDILPFTEVEKHSDFFNFLSENFEHTYWVAGNHEYYHSDLGKRRGVFHENIRENVHLVNNTSVIHGNAKIIFSTMWTSISPMNAWSIMRGMNDFNYIKFEGHSLKAFDYNQVFEENFEFIKNAVTSNDQEKCMVVTHHVPTLKNYPAEYRNSPLNEAFAVNLDDFIAGSNIDFWLYGHHHRNIPDFIIENTRLITNQLGYVGHNEHLVFDRGKVVEI